MKTKKLLALLLTLTMIVSIMPSFTINVFAEDTQPTVLQTSIKENTNQNGGVVYTKKSTLYDDGTIDIELSAYTKGTVTDTTTVKPVDIVLVLDVSGSMDDSYSGTTKIKALQNAVNAFIDSTYASNEGQDADKKHRISIVKFAGPYYSNGSQTNPTTAVGNGTYTSGWFTYNYTQVVKALTTVDSAGVTQLKTAVNGLDPSGATAVDKGLALAKAVLDEASGTDRDEVVIVFTDGDPNHSNNFDANVANNAISTASTLKASGVTVYGVCIASGANSEDVSSNTNKFMHYVSSNYPDATSLNSGGTRAEGSNYYLTPTNASELGEIFAAIGEGIVHSPVIELGSEATVVDTLSPYFDFENSSASGVQLMVSDYMGNGQWAAPVLATEQGIILTPVFENDRLTIDGFDFDYNHISEQAREGFYGRKLVIKFKVIPDYDAIDAAQVDFSGGLLPTNTGFALLNDSDDTSAAEVETPELKIHQVVYKVDNVEYATYDRFKGAYITIDEEPTKEGYEFSGWSVTENFTMPDNNVEIVGTFTPLNYKVNYVFSGYVPAEAVGLLPDGRDDVPCNSVYEIADVIDAESFGYTFVGWSPLQSGVDTYLDSEDGKYKLVMPAGDVTLVGHFEPGKNTQYVVKHYLETLDGGWQLEDTEHKVGETDKTVTATPNTYHGFTYDESVSTYEDTISGTGDTVLELYYTRNKYKVYYEIDGHTPSGVTVPPDEEVPYGKEVTIEDVLSADGYDFEGWYYASDDTYANVSGTTFTMPDRDIYIAGHFTTRNDTLYTVKHFIQNAQDDEYTEDLNLRQELQGVTDTLVTATALNLPNVKLRAGDPSTQTGVVAGDGSLVFEFYYDRLTYKVTYVYEGTIPTDPDLIDPDTLTQEDIRYGATVIVDTTVPDAPLPAGFGGFEGWTQHSDDVEIINGEFTMPARDVEFTGYFIPDDNRWYTVEHYLQDADDEDLYVLDAHYTENIQGATFQTVTAHHLPAVLGLGFTANTTHPEQILSGEIEEDADLTLKVFYDRKEFNVTYVYEGDIPDGAEDIENFVDGDSPYKHGERVYFLGEPYEVAGYTFSGWHIHDATVEVDGNWFTMPVKDVVVYGRYVPNTDTLYKVNHFLQNIDGTYNVTPDRQESFTATTGDTVYGNPVPYEGFTFDETSQREAVVAGNGSTEINLYYVRNKRTVTYKYAGTLPNVVPDLPEGNPFTHSYEEEVSIKDLPEEVINYSFHGWTVTDENLSVSDNKFIMPDHDVEIIGHWHPGTNTPYTINHFLQNPDGTYSSFPYETEIRQGTADQFIKVYAKEYTGYSVDFDTTTGEVYDSVTGYTTMEKQISNIGDTTFDFYYSANPHQVKYVYEGFQPTGAATQRPTPETKLFGARVEIAPKPYVAGYEFIGWSTEDVTLGTTTFIMPDKDVTLKGKFVTADIDYKVNYWLENLENDDYTLELEKTLSAKFGAHVEAEKIKYEGFVYNQALSNPYGHIEIDSEGNGTTVLNIYLDRIVSNVIYKYVGIIPENPPTLSGYNKTGIKAGTVLDVEDVVAKDGYVFEGWTTHTAVVDDGKFTMPGHNVEFLGAFLKYYTVKYDLKGGDGAEGVDYTERAAVANTVIDVNAAPTKSGYTFKGWKEGTSTLEPGNTVVVDKDLTFVAQWSKNSSGGGGGGGSSLLNYTLTYETNGGTEIPKETHEPDTNVKINKTTTKSGYIFEGWYLDSELTQNVTEVTMNKNITVYAKWVKDNGGAGSGHITPGSLNGKDHFAYVVGYPDGTVRPDDNISRAETASIFFRLLVDKVREANLTEQNQFNDVSQEDWYNKAVSTMAKLGIVTGRYEGKFVGDANITRAEFATICARFDDSEFTVVDTFTDISGHWAEQDIHEAAAHGWIKGYEDGTFKPDQFITRAEAMTMINRVLNRIPESADDLLKDMIIWPDNNVDDWYYLAVQEATNSHEYKMKNNIYERWTHLREVTDWTIYEK